MRDFISKLIFVSKVISFIFLMSWIPGSREMVHLDSLLYHTFTSYIHVRGVKCLREERGKHEIPVCRGVARLNIVSPEERRGEECWCRLATPLQRPSLLGSQLALVAQSAQWERVSEDQTIRMARSRTASGGERKSPKISGGSFKESGNCYFQQFCLPSNTLSLKLGIK